MGRREGAHGNVKGARPTGGGKKKRNSVLAMNTRRGKKEGVCDWPVPQGRELRDDYLIRKKGEKGKKGNP